MSTTTWSSEFPQAAHALAKAKLHGRTGQAYLLIGDSTEQLERFALGWAQTAACTSPQPDGMPCGHCRNCTLLQDGNYSELVRLAPESKSRIIPVDAMHEFERKIILAVPEGMLKIGLIVEADCMKAEAANAFLKRLTALGIRCYRHYPIEGYPSDVDFVVSEEGLGKNDYIETSRSLVVVTAPGPGSGKMATCISQLYHEHKRGVTAGYAKFETFPIWSLPLKHPVNLAYEAATADLNDVNMIDPFHLEAYGKTAVNYNRDVEIFPVLNAIFEQIQGSSPYKSPTDMGVNMAGFCIVDDEACRIASKREILRRYYTACVERVQGKADDEPIRKLELLMKQAGVTPDTLPAVSAALLKAETTGAPAGAMVLPDGRVVTGKTSDNLGAASSLLLNALKALGGIDDQFDLISTQVLEPICDLKTRYLHHRNPRLHTDEVLMALTICALTNPMAELAKEQLDNLKGCDAHFTVILSEEDESLLKRLGINVSSEPRYEINRLYHK